MAKPIDIIGERFGNLVVVGRAENNSRGNTQWICKCDCGNVKTCLGYDLTHGRVVTCGCSINMKGKPSKKRISLVGNKYGKLTVVSLNEELSSTNALVWNCLCDCGNTFTARGGNLKYGKATHCGCSKKEFPNNFKDLTGIRFGKLTVVKMYSHERKNIKWLCKCDCGEDVIFTGSQLKKGKLPPCIVEERNKNKRPKPPKRNVKKPRNVKNERLYVAWYSMHSRCKETYHCRNSYYDRGICVCDEWNDYIVFQEWALNNGYRDDLSLDRIDVNGNYEPSNCRWTTMKVQQNNKTNNHLVTINGITKTLSEWSDYSGIPSQTIKARINRGWSGEKLIEPLHKNQYQ